MEAIKSINNRVNITKNYIFILFIMALILAIILLAYTYVNSVDQSDLIHVPHIEDPVIVKNVTLYGSDGSEEQVDLPVKRSPNHVFRYKFTVQPDIHGMQQCVNVNVSYISFVISHDGEQLYTNPVTEGFDLPSNGNSFNIIELPAELIGEELEIEFRSNLSSDRLLKIPHVLIGTKTQIIGYYLNLDLFKILAAVALFITAILISVIGVFFIKIRQTSRNLFIAVLFAVIMSLYIVFRPWVTIYYLDNCLIAYFTEYTCLMLLPLPIILLFLNVFCENNIYDWRVVSFELMAVIIFINLFVQWTLTLLGISEFIEMQRTTFFLILFFSVFILATVYSMDGNRIKDKKMLAISITPLGFMLIVDVLAYYQSYVVPMVPSIIFAAIFFMMIHLFLTLKTYALEYNIALENDFYSQLAYFDTLTQLANRHDFEKDINRIVSKQITFRNMYLIMLDMNNLKKINDNFGHHVGDVYLKAAGDMLHNLQDKYGNIKSYRYGGDEFIVLAYNKRESEIEKIIQDVNALSNKKIVEECNYGLEFALGYSLCMDQNSFAILAFKDEADKRMYEDKKRKKEMR